MDCHWSRIFTMHAHFRWISFLLLMLLNAPDKVQADDFVVLGNEGVWVRQGSTILSGDIGANQSSVGQYLNGAQEITIGHNVLIQDSESRVMGSTIRLKS